MERPAPLDQAAANDRVKAIDVLRRHAEHSSVALALNRETEHFMADGIDGLIAYRTAGRHHAVQIGSVYAAAADQAALLREFHAWAHGQGRKLSAVQLTTEDLALYADAGYKLGQLGASYSIELGGFTLSGRKFEKIRNKVKRARKAGITVVEAGPELPYDDALAERLDRLDAQWLRAKGWHIKQIEFMVGERGRPGDTIRRLFVAMRDGEPIAYVSYSPVFGTRAGWLYDITRRDPKSPPGVVELIFVEALQRFAGEGVAWLHLGLTPFCEISPDHRPPAGAHSGMEKLVRLIASHGEFIYPARSQSEFKVKWQPSSIQPEYAGFHPGVSASAVWKLLRLTRSI